MRENYFTIVLKKKTFESLKLKLNKVLMTFKKTRWGRIAKIYGRLKMGFNILIAEPSLLNIFHTFELKRTAIYRNT